MKFWEENIIRSTQTFLDYILSIWLPGGGYPFSAKNNIAFHEFLNSPKDFKLNRRATHQTLNQMKKMSKKSCTEFEFLYTQINKTLSRKSSAIKKYSFYMPIDAEFENNIKFPISFKLLDYKFQFTDNLPYSQKLLSNFPSSLFECEDEVKGYLNLKERVFLNISSQGEDWYQAWNNVTLPFDVLRGIIEFSFGFRTFQLSVKSRPRAKVPYPRWMLIRDEMNSYDGSAINVPKYVSIKKFKFMERHFKIIKNNARVIRSIPQKNSSKQILTNCLRLYSEAMDGYYEYHQFLSLWQIAENISLSSESKKVANRIAWFGKNIGLVSTGYKNILNQLANKRVNLVHKGASDNIDENDVNHLKYAIDTALLWLYKVVDKLKTISHLSYYFSYREKSKSDLNSIKESLKMLSKIN